VAKLEDKQKVVQEIQALIEESGLVVFTDYRGLSVAEITELRSKLRQPGVTFKVFKNTLTEFALKNAGYADMAEEIGGPNAVLFSKQDLVAPAKTIYDFIKQYKKLEVKLGIVEGQKVNADKIKALADLPPREVLLAQMLGTMQAPITSVVYVLNANLTGLVRSLDQVREQKAS